ncbi:thioesterase family protein [Undibacterium griseum]|uniref:Medium/long-chain acyl-CoA thioesterase YigI n=1 Tax=Undibacterium griseum TaxID=2762295 RepID=A0ABR6YRD4_9BURK|nr:thioesterase family protein [Undibacterium griseum]MBC3886330.1 thioesterase family protein [Undibacterium griseum]
MKNRIVDDPEFQKLLAQIIEEQIPFCRLLGMKAHSLAPDSPALTLTMKPELLGNFAQGMLHGGVIASVLDSVAGVAILLKLAQQQPKDDVFSQLREFGLMSTIDLRIDYLKPGKGQLFTANAEVTRLGKRVANVLMTLRNEQNELVATGAAAFMLHGRN